MYFCFFFIIGIFCYDYFVRQGFKKNYKRNGEYAIGKIYGIKEYGRATGYYNLYLFKIGNQEYKGRSDGNLSFSQAPQNIGKRFLVLYLKTDIHNNAIYVSIPVNDSIKSNSELQKWISAHPEIKSKLDSIPGSGFFFENYF
ncbi:hypothetical protein CEY12_05395 [Chryseobacterium sp. T16E-39]|uniref:hypothetical protein n=1 Tax=Chryseobacterium sp. T16E-39 TaxID=2015076 RepID=UPI000B5B41AB|nr:hypothetical protein [Chryseobacterium sp. T16E-39]ASK29574.1 hypothetical protein CEY12_05395 [Chryseobacterium sp. T16E-39]